MLRKQHIVDVDVIVCACIDADKSGSIHVSVYVLAELHVTACALLYLVWPALRWLSTAFHTLLTQGHVVSTTFTPLRYTIVERKM